MWACPSQSLGSRFPLQVLARPSAPLRTALWAFRFNRSREAPSRQTIECYEPTKREAHGNLSVDARH